MYEYYDEDGFGITGDEAHDQYNDMLNDCYDEVSVGGMTWTPSEVLEKMDPVAYRCGFNDFEDSQLQDGSWFEEDPTEEEEEEEEEIDWEQCWEDFDKGLNGGLTDPSHPNNKN